MSKRKPPKGISMMVIKSFCRQVEKMIREGDGTIYIIDEKHYFLWFGEWLWIVSDRKEMEHLVTGSEFPELPDIHSQFEYVKEFIETIKASEKMPRYSIKSDPSIPKVKRKRDYQENLRQWALTKLDNNEFPPDKQEETQ